MVQCIDFFFSKLSNAFITKCVPCGMLYAKETDMPGHPELSNKPDFIEGGCEMYSPSASSSAGFTER